MPNNFAPAKFRFLSIFLKLNVQEALQYEEDEDRLDRLSLCLGVSASIRSR
jgi:hypothetical protein